MAKTTTHPAERTSPNRSTKYPLVRIALRTDPLAWMERRRGENFRHPDGRRRPMTFRELAVEVNARLSRANIDETVTFETLRAWYRAQHPRG